MHCDKYGISATSWLGINTTMDHIGEKKSTDKFIELTVKSVNMSSFFVLLHNLLLSGKLPLILKEYYITESLVRKFTI